MTPIGRRKLVAGFGILTAAGLLARTSAANIIGDDVRKVAFLNLHTGERTRVAYKENGSFVPEALREIATVLRDHRTGEVKEIDTKLLDLLYVLRGRLETQKPFGVISAYRSPHTNAMLAGRSGGVAKRSMHIEGRAIDIRVQGIDTKSVFRVARGLRAGGVGLYSNSNFIHVDTGRVRYWGR